MAQTKNRFALILSTIFCLSQPLSIRAADLAQGQQPEQCDQVLKQLDELIADYYPKAKRTMSGNVFHCESRVENKIGHYSRKESLVPQAGGILLDVQILPGKYSGRDLKKLNMDQIDGYSTTYLMAPYSPKRNCHMLARLIFPPDIPPDFKLKFKEIVENFDELLSAEQANASRKASSQTPANPPKHQEEQKTPASTTAEPATIQTAEQKSVGDAPSNPLTSSKASNVAPVEEAEKQYIFEGKTLTAVQNKGFAAYLEALKSLDDGKWESAENHLSQALTDFPELYLAHSTKAYVLAKRGRVEEAIKEAEEARRLAPNKVAPLGVLASIYQGSGKLNDAIRQYEELTKRFPKHPSAATIRSLTEALRLESAKQTAIAKKLKSGINANMPNYFEFISYAGVAKWKKKRFPLKVYVPSDEEAAHTRGYTPEYGKALREAFSEWQKDSLEVIKFEMVPNRSESDIDCCWSDKVAALSNPSECGEARSTIDSERSMLHAKIILLTMTPGNPRIPVNEMKCTALHEIGHSLGLHGHSPLPEDTLFCSVPIVDRTASLSKRDIKTLAYLYKDSVHETEVTPLPVLPDNSFSISEAGVELLAKKDYANAALRFESALKINPNCAPARRNLALCLKESAVESERKENWENVAKDLEKIVKLNIEGDEDDRTASVATLKNLEKAYVKLNKNSDAMLVSAIIAKASDNSDDHSLTPYLDTGFLSHVEVSPGGSDNAELNGDQTTIKTSSKADQSKGASDVPLSAIPNSNPSKPLEKADDKQESTDIAWSFLTPDTPTVASSRTFHIGIEERADTSDQPVDFGDYMKDLQRRIKRAWFPPKGNESKRIKVVFAVESNGVLKNLRISKSSGVAIADRAATKAIENAAPFRPLPDGAPNEVDIEFTFDYNVFHGNDKVPFQDAPAIGNIATYKSYILATISKSWQPMACTQPVLAITINKDGTVVATAVLKTSGNPRLDRIAVLAITKVKYDPLPEWYKGKELKLSVDMAKLPFKYRSGG